ncbi:hypothetical protein B566_EDAN012567 [Ephemera danica]|nr:hypothetical protein B566_EDAN012567 [Ephemera danica]
MVHLAFPFIITLLGMVTSATAAPQCSAALELCRKNYAEFQPKVDDLTSQLSNVVSQLNELSKEFSELKTQEDTLQFQIANPGEETPTQEHLVHYHATPPQVAVKVLSNDTGCAAILKECHAETPKAQTLLEEQKALVEHQQEHVMHLKETNVSLQARINKLTSKIGSQ